MHEDLLIIIEMIPDDTIYQYASVGTNAEGEAFTYPTIHGTDNPTYIKFKSALERLNQFMIFCAYDCPDELVIYY